MIERPIAFPQDEGQHKNITEWWYLNGNLCDEGGREFSYMSTIFHVRYPAILGGFFRLLPSSDKYFYHGIVTDIETGRSRSHVEILDNNGAKVSENKLSIIISGAKTKDHYLLENTGKAEYQVSGNGIALSLQSNKPLVLVGGDGLVDNVGEKTFYYSLTSLESTGIIEFDGVKHTVTGRSWMDHQWGDFGAPRGYWNWFSIQLNNEMEIVCYESGSKKGKKTLASINDSEGKTTTYSEITIFETGEYWLSPKTKARYPLSWEIEIPEAKIKITVKAKVKDHEINFWYINYWEGPSEVEATINGKKVPGKGFIEVVGRESKIPRYGPIGSFILGQRAKYKYL